MRSAKLAKKNPREIAQIIVDHLPENDLVQSGGHRRPRLHQHPLGSRTALQGVAAAGARREGRLRHAATIPEGERKINLEYISR